MDSGLYKALVISLFLFFLYLMWSMGGCSRGHKNTTNNTSLAAKYQLYQDEGDPKITPACDFATFAMHAAALGVHIENPALLEATSGVLIRNPQLSCYPGTSGATISREGYIGWLHYIWTVKDLAALKRIITHGESNGWIFGEGDVDMINMTPLKPIIYIMLAKMESPKLTDNVEALQAEFTDTLMGFKGHVMASYLWLWTRVNREIGPVGLEMIIQLHGVNADDPMYAALYARWVDGNFESVNHMLGTSLGFPDSSVPTGVGGYLWGSAPDFLTFMISYAILGGF